MKNFVVIADQDRGKSRFVKEEILKKFTKRDNYICDINNEYGNFKNCYTDIPDRETFLKAVPSGDGSFVNMICEEASMFFSRSGTQPSSTMLHICRRFHTKNINVFIFHSIKQVPIDILVHIDFIVLFRTSDDPAVIKKDYSAYPKLVNAFTKVRQITNGTAFDREKQIYLPGSYLNENGEKVEVSAEYSKNNFHKKIIIAKPFN